MAATMMKNRPEPKQFSVTDDPKKSGSSTPSLRGHGVLNQTMSIIVRAQ
jgi:hypothetical protein